MSSLKERLETHPIRNLNAVIKSIKSEIAPKLALSKDRKRHSKAKLIEHILLLDKMGLLKQDIPSYNTPKKEKAPPKPKKEKAPKEKAPPKLKKPSSVPDKGQALADFILPNGIKVRDYDKKELFNFYRDIYLKFYRKDKSYVRWMRDEEKAKEKAKPKKEKSPGAKEAERIKKKVEKEKKDKSIKIDLEKAKKSGIKIDKEKAKKAGVILTNAPPKKKKEKASKGSIPSELSQDKEYAKNLKKRYTDHKKDLGDMSNKEIITFIKQDIKREEFNLKEINRVLKDTTDKEAFRKFTRVDREAIKKALKLYNDDLKEVEKKSKPKKKKFNVKPAPAKTESKGFRVEKALDPKSIAKPSAAIQKANEMARKRKEKEKVENEKKEVVVKQLLKEIEKLIKGNSLLKKKYAEALTSNNPIYLESQIKKIKQDIKKK